MSKLKQTRQFSWQNIEMEELEDWKRGIAGFRLKANNVIFLVISKALLQA